MASESRNLELSLYYRAFQIALQRGYYVDQEDVPLAKVLDATHTWEFTANQYPWVFMDEGMNPWNGVVVRVNGDVQDPTTYAVDYLAGQVTFSTPPGADDEVRADFRTYTLTIRQGYPTDEELKMVNLPCIATDAPNHFQRPLGIGLPFKIRTKVCTIDILGLTPGDWVDLLDYYERDMVAVQLIDFSAGQPLGRNNSLNSSFNYADQRTGRLAQLVDPKGQKILPRPGGLDKERYRALVTLEVENVS